MSTLNATFKIIADPSRRKILHLLRPGEMTAGNLAEYFDMTKPTVSHHFSILEETDLVSSRKDGQTVWYRVRIDWRDTPQTTALSRPPP